MCRPLLLCANNASKGGRGARVSAVKGDSDEAVLILCVLLTPTAQREEQSIIRSLPSGLWLRDSGRFLPPTISTGCPGASSRLPPEHQRLSTAGENIRWICEMI